MTVYLVCHELFSRQNIDFFTVGVNEKISRDLLI